MNAIQLAQSSTEHYIPEELHDMIVKRHKMWRRDFLQKVRKNDNVEKPQGLHKRKSSQIKVIDNGDKCRMNMKPDLWIIRAKEDIVGVRRLQK